MSATLGDGRKTLKFKAEAYQLLQLVIHSVYSNKDVFLRELISNASDALDKLRMETYCDKELDADISDPHIFIELDTAASTLAVSDNGIGMSYDEVVRLIGTLAQSGTSDFAESLRNGNASVSGPDLIGQFGIGFYASFMVADSVTLVSRRAGEDEGTRWQSDGRATYTIETVHDAPQGTSVKLKLKPADAEDGLLDYSDPWIVRDIVTRYSDFISWPIRMAAENADATEEFEADDDEAQDSVEDSSPNIETVNSMRALWARAKKEVTNQEYRDFYRYITRDWNDPLETIHVKAEGTLQYDALLYIPPIAPYDLFQRERRGGIQLYINRVLVEANSDALLPDYLRFVSGVVDAQGLSLNVSREMLQHDRHIQLMRRRLTKSVLTAIKELMTAKPDEYAQFWAQFGRAIKEGLISDPDNRSAILSLASFASTNGTTALTTLREYAERMSDKEERIYYAVGESRSLLENSPHMEVFRARGIEVLLLTDPIDDLWARSVPAFDHIPFESITQATLTLEEQRREDEPTEVDAQPDHSADQAQTEDETEQFAKLLDWLGNTLGDAVSEVRLSARLTTSPLCLSTDPYSLTPSQEKTYRANGYDVPAIKRALELNPSHPLIIGLQTALAEHDNSDAAQDLRLTRSADLMLGMALLAEGGDVPDPARFVQTLATQLTEQYDSSADQRPR